ncbi:predicted protein [Chaetomium globosum CBS 148.51]|uniref:Uncharacterized protein n=1 Tax=Chaetomium globosum (strain ATCC 6205 / CBS 148.51 / DSM 1962 / NBRC 6347 / NRRL 1970) TaxID=306901 RepID=Q2H7Q7_CHAGB|nr:uncharacterized protein CHGG_05308 [Chaetomium globosum CBS 148.51]EAQ88689.1 predicted protein [Chaetomium globosum CBS 148.51]
MEAWCHGIPIPPSELSRNDAGPRLHGVAVPFCCICIPKFPLKTASRETSQEQQLTWVGRSAGSSLRCSGAQMLRCSGTSEEDTSELAQNVCPISPRKWGGDVDDGKVDRAPGCNSDHPTGRQS